MASVLIFGATGLVGNCFVEEIISANAQFARVGIFTSKNTVQTKSDKIKKFQNAGLRVHIGDINDDNDVTNALKDYDTVVSAVGRNAIGSQIPLLRLAEATSNVRRFFPSEYGTDVEYSACSAQENPNQAKLRVREFIKEHVRRLRITYLVVGPYADLYLGRMEGKYENLGSFNITERRAVLLGSGEERVSFTTMHDLAKFLLAALKHPEETQFRTLKLNSFTATPNEILAEFETHTERLWAVEYTPLDKLRDLEQDAWEASDAMATLYTLRRIWTEGNTLYTHRDNYIIDAEDTETLGDAVARALKTEAKGFQSGEM